MVIKIKAGYFIKLFWKSYQCKTLQRLEVEGSLLGIPFSLPIKFNKKRVYVLRSSHAQNKAAECLEQCIWLGCRQPFWFFSVIFFLKSHLFFNEGTLFSKLVCSFEFSRFSCFKLLFIETFRHFLCLWCFFSILVMIDFSLFNFIKVLIVHGKQTISYGIICDCFFYLKLSFGSLYIWSVLKTIEPVVEVRILRRGGRIYFVPFPLRQGRAFSLARRWLIESAKKRKLCSIGHCLALELKDIYLGFGASVFKRNQNQAQALANRGNLGFRWLTYFGGIA